MGTAPSDWQNPKTNWGAADVVGPQDFNRIEGNINAIETGSRTLDQTQVPSGNVGSLRQILDWFAHSIKMIKGTTNWYDPTPTSLQNLVINVVSNSNGSYVRFGNLQVCWKYEPNPSFVAVSTFNAFGSTAYYTRFTWTYPAPFAETPAVFVTPTTSGFPSAYVFLTDKTYAICRFVNSINQFNGPINLLAIGRW